MAEPISKHCWATPKCGISYAKKHFGSINVDDNDFKFIIVRNPYQRIVSFYCQKVIQHSRGETKIPHYCEVTKITKDLEYYRYFEIEPNISFENFIKDLETRDIFKMERHLKPQVSNIENILFHKVVHLENFNEDIKEVCYELGINYDVLIKNPIENTYNKTNELTDSVYDKTPNWFLKNGIPSNYNLFYNSEIKEKVYKIYEADFQILEYNK